MTKSGQTPDKTEGPSPKQTLIAAGTISAILVYLTLRYGVRLSSSVHGYPLYQLPLIAALVFGGGPLLAELLVKLLHREFGSDLLAGISIVTSAILGTIGGATGNEYLAGALVVL